MNQILLAGCAPAPLASYLKALGVLRILAGPQPETRASWRGESFELHTPLTILQLEHFFLQDYQPTPVIAPWNSGSGFYFQEHKSKEKDPHTGKKLKLGIFDQPTAATQVVAIIRASTSERLRDYREALKQATDLVGLSKLVEAPPSGQSKNDLVRALRGTLPDHCLDWLDAALLLAGGGLEFPRLLGTGGNDGNLDFTSNFMQRLVEVMGTTPNSLPPMSKEWLRTSLFGIPAAGLTHSSIGQFSPGQAGGPNASTGFKADPIINPWDFVLMIEGSLAFAAAAVRRGAIDAKGAASFPFTVKAVGAGAGSLGEKDGASSRGELWMPLWSGRASYAEIRALLAEGRVALGRKPARDALDFARAVHQLGCYRGIDSFQRYALLKRSGKDHLATPLRRIAVTGEPSTSLLDDLDRNRWLDSFRRFAHGKDAASHFKALCHRLEDTIFAFTGQRASAQQAQAFLEQLGAIQAALARSNKARDAVDPLPLLSQPWVAAADDGSPAFRIARALAGLRGVPDFPLPLRAQLFPVHTSVSKWIGSLDGDKASKRNRLPAVRLHTSASGGIPRRLLAFLARRLWLITKLELNDKPLQSAASATVEDVAAFLRSDSMDHHITSLLPGLSLCSISAEPPEGGGDESLPAAFTLMKLCLTPDKILRGLGALGSNDHLPLPVGLAAQLSSGHKPERAVLAAWRRLHASGLEPVFSRHSLPTLTGVSPLRAGAALLIPLSFAAYAQLTRQALKSAGAQQPRKD